VNCEDREFAIGRSAILGEPNYENGAVVHAYYRKVPEGFAITMLLRKVKSAKDIPAVSEEPLNPSRPRGY
jgi:hypothetical protein